MRAIGFRVEPKAIHFAVVDLTTDGLVLFSHGKYSAPRAYDDVEPKALRWYRERVRTEVAKYSPQRAGVRFPETFGRKGITNSDFKRLRIEGVILESLESENVAVFGGAMKSISAALGSDSAKAYVKEPELRGLDWSDRNEKCREAILAAAAALEFKQ